MPGLLDYQVDPIAMGLLGAGGALMTPRAQGGGIGAAMQAFPQQMMQGQEMQRRMQAQAMQQKALTDRAEMDRKRFGMEEQEFGLRRDEATRKQAEMRTKMERIQQVRGQIALEKPELLPMFDMDPMKAMERMFPEPGKPQVVAPGAALVQDGKAIFNQPANPPAPTELERLQRLRSSLPPGDPRLREVNDAIRKASQFAPAPTTNVTINQGQKGFDNERALRGEFQGSATTKAFSEVQGAYDIIKGALSNPSGANDLAAATKFMKLLDPGSVVRESELGMAMAATGVVDRAQNYVQMMASGQKLTPQQRKDFLAAANQIYSAARQRYGESAQNMRTQAQKWELDPDAVAPTGWKIHGYKSKDAAVQDARNALMKNPEAKAEIIRRLTEDMGITDHGIR
jgi:hypothetical protein